jgi:hypothetical protein
MADSEIMFVMSGTCFHAVAILSNPIVNLCKRLWLSKM